MMNAKFIYKACVTITIYRRQKRHWKCFKDSHVGLFFLSVREGSHFRAVEAFYRM